MRTVWREKSLFLCQPLPSGTRPTRNFPFCGLSPLELQSASCNLMSDVKRPPLHLAGELDQVPSLDGFLSGTSHHGSPQANARQNRPRRQVRETKAGGRDRKDQTADEFKHGTAVLSDALEKNEVEKRTLRARLSRCESVDPGPDGARGGLADTDVVGLGSSAWSCSSTSHTERRPSMEFKKSLTSGVPSTGWNREEGSKHLADEQLPVSARPSVSLRTHHQTTTLSLHAAIPARQGMSGNSHTVPQGQRPERFSLPEDAPNAAENRYRETQDGFMDRSPARLAEPHSEAGAGQLSASGGVVPPQHMGHSAGLRFYAQVWARARAPQDSARAIERFGATDAAL